jgi:hypothetical protein
MACLPRPPAFSCEQPAIDSKTIAATGNSHDPKCSRKGLSMSMEEIRITDGTAHFAPKYPRLREQLLRHVSTNVSHDPARNSLAPSFVEKRLQAPTHRIAHSPNAPRGLRT